MKSLWIITGLWGCAAVALGAIANHALDEVPADGLAALETASRYHLPHVAAAGLALVLSERAGRLALIAAALFLASVVCFSGSIYVAVLTGVKIPIAPIGGIGFMIGWLLLGISGWRAASRL
jgi:uncharacterized membrane protein YgdD (TMEM256/DUF423 family)